MRALFSPVCSSGCIPVFARLQNNDPITQEKLEFEEQAKAAAEVRVFVARVPCE